MMHECSKVAPTLRIASTYLPVGSYRYCSSPNVILEPTGTLTWYACMYTETMTLQVVVLLPVARTWHHIEDGLIIASKI